MSYTDMRDFDPEFTWEDSDFGIVVQVEKSGGGTVGKAYVGLWRYKVYHDATKMLISKGQDFQTGTPKTHEQVGKMLVECVTLDHTQV